MTAVAPFARTRLVAGLSTVGVIACGWWLARTDDVALDHTFLLVLCAAAVVAALALIDIEGTVFLGASLVPNVCAVAALGPAGAAVVAAVGEVAVLAVDRYRWTAFPLNLFSSVAPNVVAAVTFQALAPSSHGLAYYLVLVGIALACVVLNTTLVTCLSGLEQGLPIFSRLWGFRRLAPILGINIALAISAVAVYDHEGSVASIFVLAGILAFVYLAKQIAAEREHLARIMALAAERGNLVTQILEAEDRQRRRVAEVLHDDVIQALLVARQELDAVREATPSECAERATDAVTAALAQVRGAIAGTHPSALDRLGLAAAVAMVAETEAARCGTKFDVRVSGPVPAQYDRLLFSTARELIANIGRHAAAALASVTIFLRDRQIVLEVWDDGVGITSDARDAAARRGHIGLSAVEERVQAISGTFCIARRPEGGTCAVVTLPIPANAVTGTPLAEAGVL